VKAANVRPRRNISVRSLVVAILITAGLTSAFWAAILLWQSIPSTPSGPLVGMRIDAPERVKVGEVFDLKVILINRDKGTVVLNGFELDDSLLKGIDVLSVQPEFYAKSEQQTSQTFKFGDLLKRGTSVYTFRLQPKIRKVFKGEIDAYVSRHWLGAVMVEFTVE
jgi:hypothetical protein